MPRRRPLDWSRLTVLQRILLVLTGPWLFWPLTLLVGWAADSLLGRWLPAELYDHAERALFFQGGTDWGGGLCYAIQAAVLAFWAVWLAWYLSLALHAIPLRNLQYRHRLLLSLQFLLPSVGVAIVLGVVFGVSSWIESFVHPSGPRTPLTPADWDFVVQIATGALVAVLSVLWVAWLDGRERWSAWRKFVLAPAVAVLWFVMASDGQTPRAGQRLGAGWNPLPAVRGVRHAVMLSWYNLIAPGRPAGAVDSPWWYWTDGRIEFGTATDRSPSARALRVRADLPWMRGRTAYVIPVAVDPDAPAADAFPYHAYDRHHSGYCLATPGGPFFLPVGRISAKAFRPVHLPSGTPYWRLDIPADAPVRCTLCLYCRTPYPPEPPVPLETLLAAPPAPVEIRVTPDTPFSALSSTLLRLQTAGFDEVFLAMSSLRQVEPDF